MKQPQKPIQYGELRQELDEVLARLQSAELDIDEMTVVYQRGMEIIAQLETYLQKTEQVITKVKADFDKAQEVQE